MRRSDHSFASAYKISPGNVRYSDFVVAGLLYEAARDAGFWNVDWTITNMPPSSERICSQWKGLNTVSFLSATRAPH
jgi:hypothetical protein